MLCAHEIRGGTDGRGRAISRCTGMRERECRLAGGVGWAERERAWRRHRLARASTSRPKMGQGVRAGKRGGLARAWAEANLAEGRYFSFFFFNSFPISSHIYIYIRDFLGVK
jgi:hypothetical protein